MMWRPPFGGLRAKTTDLPAHNKGGPYKIMNF
jgi:hypothetical protein